MGLLDLIFKNNKSKVEDDKFDEQAYNNFNNSKINEFLNKYDLSTKEGINSIPISEATKYPNVINISVVYMPEQILSRKATEYKKALNYDLAIECLKKANELCVHSPFHYTRLDYERVVDMMVLAGKFDDARMEHKRLDEQFGTRLDELHMLQNFVFENDGESKESYQKRVIDPEIEEATDREHYYWLLENYPKLAPKSFSAFRRIKNQNSDSYNKIVNELKQLNINFNCVKFWNK